MVILNLHFAESEEKPKTTLLEETRERKRENKKAREKTRVNVRLTFTGW